MSPRRTLGLIGGVLLLLLNTTSAFAVPFMPVMDEFWIVKETATLGPSEIFRDSFDDGNVPPSGPDDGVVNPDTYTGIGAGGFTSESGGKLTMTPRLGDPNPVSGIPADYATVAVRRLTTNSNNPNFLGQDSSFEIHGLFDMSDLPMINGESFGIRASDRASAQGNQGNQTYVLFVGLGDQGGPNPGQVIVALREINFETSTSTLLDQISIQPLLPTADQIELIFEKELNAAVLTAEYNVYDSSNSTIGSGAIGGSSTLSIYDGEDYIRGGFQSTAVPAPGTLALIGLGLAGMGFARKKMKA